MNGHQETQVSILNYPPAPRERLKGAVPACLNSLGDSSLLHHPCSGESERSLFVLFFNYRGPRRCVDFVLDRSFGFPATADV
jgi:hypothetical protein